MDKEELVGSAGIVSESRPKLVAHRFVLGGHQICATPFREEVVGRRAPHMDINRDGISAMQSEECDTVRELGSDSRELPQLSVEFW